MVLLIRNNCSKCKKVVRDVFTNRIYIDRLNRKFIPIIINIDSKSSYPIELYYSTKYPVLFFVNSKDENFLNNSIYY